MNKQDEKYLIKLLQKYCNKEDRILDIGCGIGENLRLLKIHNYNNIYGVDISQMMVEYCKNLGFRVYEINQIEALEKFDVLLFAHVLEHINYPEIKTGLVMEVGIKDTCLYPVGCFTKKDILNSMADFLVPRWQLVNKTFLRKAKKYSVKVFPWEIRERNIAERFLKEDVVKGIITNKPDLMK